MPWLLILLLSSVIIGETALLDSFKGATLVLDLLVLFASFRFGLEFYQAFKKLWTRPDYHNAEAISATSKRQIWSVLKMLLCLIALSALGIWTFRWLHGWELASSYKDSLNFRVQLDLALLCAGLVEFMKWRPVEKIWARLELTPPRIGLFFYLGISFLGAWVLLLPFSLKTGATLSVVNSLFISVSAITVTGLSPINPGETFSIVGLCFLMLILHIGGIGIAFFSALVASVARQRLSLTQSKVGQELYSITDLGDVSQFLKKIFLFTLFAELLGWGLIYLGLPSDLEHRSFHALFHSVSAFCNAGFSSLPMGLEIPGLAFMKSIVATLIILGGIGFPVIFELLARLRDRRLRNRPLSSGALLAVVMSAGLILVGFLAIFFTEVSVKGWSGFSLASFGHSLFASVTARTAGFNTLPVGDLALGSQFVLVLLMMVGASPISTGGGLKTTTVALLLIAVFNFFRGNTWIQFNGREISYYLLHKCIAIVFCYFLLLVFAVGFLASVEGADLWSAIFESVSALSTVGLSLGLTSQLGPLGKFALMFLMLAGRYGLVTIVFAGIGNMKEQRYRYPSGSLYVG